MAETMSPIGIANVRSARDRMNLRPSDANVM